jgi:hypothetical protein
MNELSEAALDGHARRAAKRIGLMARKSRTRTIHLNDHGGYMLIEPYRNCVVAGERFDLTAEDVIAWCAGKEPH